MTEIILKLSGTIVPKARPRFNGHNVYLSPNYLNWKKDAIINFKIQIKNMNIITPLKNIFLKIYYYGPIRGDADNISGSIMDALIEASIIEDDSVKYISKLYFEFSKTTIQKAHSIIIMELLC